MQTLAPTPVNSTRNRSPVRIAKGMIGYFRFPQQRAEWGGPFNGQSRRVEIFCELHRTYNFDSLFETGTYRGSTAEFLAQETGGDVRTIEVDPWSYGYCLARFFLQRRISVTFGDSRKFIAKLRRRSGAPPFFYLDAHWGDELPLAEELIQILQRWEDAIVMIDDFQVPDDEHYGFDDYGDGKRLTLEYIASVISAFQLRAFFPVASAGGETGARRGCVVLMSRNVEMPKQAFATLRQFRQDAFVASVA